jgi:misacylated tRNA(Ala) deacylase
MTRLLYYADSYTHSFSSVVSAVDEVNRTVVLEQTAFYPGGGGQPADAGTLVSGDNTWHVTRARKGTQGIEHVLEDGGTIPPVGTILTGEVDWTRRYQLMRTHTAMHILCGVIFRDYAAQVTGGDMEPLNGRMDFEFENLTKDLVAVIETAVNREVAAARPIHTRSLPREEAFQIPDLIRTKINLLPPGISEVRVVQIAGLDLQADGGTHVANTCEVGNMHVVDYKSKGKINKRIYIELDA